MLGLPGSQEGKELKIKVKLSTLIMLAALKPNEQEHQAAGVGRKGFPHSAHSCQPVLLLMVCDVHSLLGPKENYLHMLIESPLESSTDELKSY